MWMLWWDKPGGVRHPDWRVPHLVTGFEVCVCVCVKLTKQWMLCERGPTVTGLLGGGSKGVVRA